MQPALIPKNEDERLSASRQYLDTACEEIFEEITRLAVFICQPPISLINLIDKTGNISTEEVCGILA